MITLTSADLELWLTAWLYPFFRVLALFTSAPLLSHKSIPARVRIALSLFVTILIAPTAPAAAVSPYSVTGVLLIVQQVVIGVALGFAIQIAFAAAELAGDLIGLQMGLSFASFIDPQNSEQTPIVGSFLGLATMLLFFSINGHLFLIGALAETFQTIPVGIDGLNWLSWSPLVASGSAVFSAGLQIAMPVIGALILANLALGVLTRAAPQLNLFAVGFPITLIAGMLVLLLALPRVFPVLIGVLERGLALTGR